MLIVKSGIWLDRRSQNRGSTVQSYFTFIRDRSFFMSMGGGGGGEAGGIWLIATTKLYDLPLAYAIFFHMAPPQAVTIFF